MIFRKALRKSRYTGRNNITRNGAASEAAIILARHRLPLVVVATEMVWKIGSDIRCHVMPSGLAI